MFTPQSSRVSRRGAAPAVVAVAAPAAEGRAREPLLLLAVWLSVMVLALLPWQVWAHAGDGYDAGMARMTAKSQGREAWVSVEVLNPRPCPGITAEAAMATRADLSVSGGLQPDGECRFTGTLQMPEQGKWTLTFSVLIDGQRSQVELPISVTDEEQVFLREDWLHVAQLPGSTSGANSSTLGRVQEALPGGTALAGVGLGVVALGLLLWRGRRHLPAEG